jgi:hypothetical protein
MLHTSIKVYQSIGYRLECFVDGQTLVSYTGMGSSVAALNVGGTVPPHTSAVEEWSATLNSTLTAS